MKILCIDSATPVAGVAVGTEETLLAEGFMNRGLTHSEALLPLIDRVLKDADLALNEIDTIAVTTGPGSFTGLRIGLATAKSLAQVGGQSLIGVPTLDALAENMAGFNGYICPLLNARRNEVYTAVYEAEGGEIAKISVDTALAPTEVFSELPCDAKEIVFLGDGAQLIREEATLRLGVRAVFVPVHNSLPRAGALLTAAFKRLAVDGLKSIFELHPFYLRRPEAEIRLEEKRCRRQ